MDGCRDFDLRDPEHADGDRFPGGHEMDHQRRRARESTGQIAAANRACGDRISFQHGFNALRIVVNNTFEQKVIFDLRSDLYSHIQLLPLRWFDNRATGDLMTRVIEDVNSVERVLIDGIEQGVVAILQVFIVVGMMFYLNAKLALLALVPFPLLIGGALAYTLTAHRPLSIATARFLSHERATAR